MKDALIVSVLSLTPRNHGARTLGWLARTPVSRLATRAFVQAYGVDLSEAEGTLADYPTLEALFTRRLKPGSRPIDRTPDTLVSPVDGTVAALGTSKDGVFSVGPNQELELSTLVGEAVEGPMDVAVLYLSPKDYHRVHVPFDGRAVAWRYLPGTLWPVFPAAVRRVPKLFTQNERLSFTLQTSRGPLYTVLVGAFGVGRITTPLCELTTNTGARPATGPLDAAVERGEELGIFHLGSTVILLSPPGTWRYSVQTGDTVRVGQAIATGAARLTGQAEEG